MSYHLINFQKVGPSTIFSIISDSLHTSSDFDIFLMCITEINTMYKKYFLLFFMQFLQLCNLIIIRNCIISYYIIFLLNFILFTLYIFNFLYYLFHIIHFIFGELILIHCTVVKTNSIFA